MAEEELITTMKMRTKGSKDALKTSPNGIRRLMLSPMKKLSHDTQKLRLVSPLDSNDLEVASVLAEGASDESVTPTKSKSHDTPGRPSTVMTNLQRGNVQTITPVSHTLTLHQMAAQGELVCIRQELVDGSDINKQDEFGLSSLLWACAFGQLPTVEYLVERGADIAIRGNHGENSMLFASCYGYQDIVKMLLKLGMAVNYVDETESSALMYAAYNNHASCVKILLEFGADITLQNEDGYTAMELAVGQGHKAEIAVSQPIYDSKGDGGAHVEHIRVHHMTSWPGKDRWTILAVAQSRCKPLLAEDGVNG